MISPGSDVHCVLFDAVGTLLYPNPPVAVVYGQVARRHGSSLSETEIAERFRQAFLRQEAIDRGKHGQRTDEERERRRWRSIVAETLCDVNDSAAAFEELWRHFALAGSWRLFHDVAEAWHALEARGFRLGVASNFDQRLRNVCFGLPPLDRCQDLFISSELGARKPGAEFFCRVQDRLQLNAKHILLVGDDWANDYLAACDAGWQAVFLDRTGDRRHTGESIRSLLQL